MKACHLVIVLFCTVMLSRIFTAIGFPHVINFLHFPLTLITTIVLLAYFKIRKRIQPLVLHLLIFFGVLFISALVNRAGVINVILDFLLLSEPFLFLLCILTVHWHHRSIKTFQYGLLSLMLLNAGFAYCQYCLLGLRIDDVEGIFLDMGAGAHIAGTVALTAAVYSFYHFPLKSLWFRGMLSLVLAYVVILSDTKQALAAFLGALSILLLIRVGNLKKVLLYAALLGGGALLIIVAAHTIFPSLMMAGRVSIFIEGFSHKFSVFPQIASYYDSIFHWFFGLGPGHTIGRLGWLIPKYISYLQPVGVTVSPVTDAVITANMEHWLTGRYGSSMFSVLFSWAGIWGDLGIVGFLAYLHLWWIVWTRFCVDELTKFLLLTVFVLGGIFSWMEEPAYMLVVVSIIGLQWQMHQHHVKRKYRAYLLHT